MLASVALVFEAHLTGKAPHLKHYDFVWRENFQVVHSEDDEYGRDHRGESEHEDDEYESPERDYLTPVAARNKNGAQSSRRDWWSETSTRDVDIQDTCKPLIEPKASNGNWNSAKNARIREAVRNSKAAQETIKHWNLSNWQL
jgi:hypothetical protein